MNQEDNAISNYVMLSGGEKVRKKEKIIFNIRIDCKAAYSVQI